MALKTTLSFQPIAYTHNVKNAFLFRFAQLRSTSFLVHALLQCQWLVWGEGGVWPANTTLAHNVMALDLPISDKGIVMFTEF